jgi:hypothetical protein
MTLQQDIKPIILSKKDINTLFVVREVIKDYNHRLEKKRQALDIRTVDQRPYVINSTSAEAFIIRALHLADRPLHFNEIVDKIEALGWKSYSKYHKFSYLEKVLRNSYYIFDRVGPATFALRGAFSTKSTAIVEVPKEKLDLTSPIPTLSDIVRSIIETETVNKVADVHQIMTEIGYDVSYSSIRKIVVSKGLQLNDVRQEDFSSKTAKENRCQ